MGRRGLVGSSGPKNYEYAAAPPRAGSLLPRGYLRKLPCPDCPADAGEGCVSSHGKVLAQVHISRRRMAIRAYREEQESGDD